MILGLSVVGVLLLAVVVWLLGRIEAHLDQICRNTIAQTIILQRAHELSDLAHEQVRKVLFD